ncbi:MAG: glycosyltransferase [Actinomycetes bacterium]
MRGRDAAGEATGGDDGRGSAARPAVSVVVATRDRRQRLGRLLDALEAQTVGRSSFELIVIDDGSADGTSQLLEGRVERLIRHEQSTGPAIARQAGWQASRSDLIAFTDDDCRPEPDWLERALVAHRDAPGSIVQGQTRPDPEEAHLLPDPLSRSIRVDGLGPFFQTCNVFYPKALLELTGGFDPTIPRPSVEDADLAMRALATGCGAVYAEDAVVNHAVEVQPLAHAVRGARRWASLIPLVERHPELRSAFPWRGLVWRETHARLLLAIAGLGLAGATGRKAFLLWVIPYLTLRHGWYPVSLLRTLRTLPKVAPVDLAEIAVLAKASVEGRRMLL